jgi:hypothetical protein
MVVQSGIILNSVFAKTIVFFASLVTAFAGSPAIGIVTANGYFTLEQSSIWGNSTLFEGAAVETNAASSELALTNGVKIQLGAASRARIWNDRFVLEKGVAQVTSPESFGITAGGLRIHGWNSNSRLRVGLTDHVEVTALAGTARVTSGQGFLMASVAAGRSMNFAMQAASATAIMRTGCLLYKDNHFILQDDTTQEVVELNGQNLAPNLGNRVEVTGTAATAKPAVTIATAVLNVTAVALRSEGGCLLVASALDARTDVGPTGANPPPAPASAPKAPKTGLSTGAKIAIGGAIAGGGVGAALAVAGGKKSTSP